MAVRRTSFLLLGLLSLFAFLSVLPLHGQGAKLRVEDEEHDMEATDEPAARENWFRKGRQASDGLTAAEHLHSAVQQKMQLRRARILRPQSKLQTNGTFSTFVGDGSTMWVPMGPAPILPDQFATQDYGPITGRATSVAVNPADASGNTVLLGGAFGGAWISHNAAAADPRSVTWDPVLDQESSLAVGSLSFSPDGAVMLVGTGEGNSAWDSYYGIGFLRSNDGGASWTEISNSTDGHSFRGLAIQRMAWSKTAGNVVAASTMFAAHGSNASYSNTLQGIYYSTDSGSTWRLAKAYEDANGTLLTSVASSHSIVWNPADHKFYAQLRYHGIYVSKPDDPSAFYRLPAQPDTAGAGTLNDAGACPQVGSTSTCPMFRGEIAINPIRNEIYTWWIQYPAAHRGIWKSTNGGASWTKLTDTGFTSCGDSSGCGSTQSFFNMTLLAIPNASNGNWTDLFLGSVNLYKCTIDPATASNASCGGAAEPFKFMNLTHVYGGTNCTAGAPAHVHPDNHDLAATNSGMVFVANDGGAYRSQNTAELNTASCNTTQPFDNLNYNMGSMAQFVWGTAVPNDPAGMLAGSQDNGSSMTYTGAATSGQQWLLTNGGDGGYNDIDPLNPKNWFTSNNDVSIQSCTLGGQCNRSNWGSNVSTSQDLVDNSDTGGDASSFYAPWMLDPKLNTSLLVGTCRIWRGPTKRTSAATWGGVAISPMLTYSGTCTSSDSNVSSIATGGSATATGSKVIWATLDSGAVWRTSDASVKPMPIWQNVSPQSAPALPISSITVDPHDGTGMTAYVTYQGFGYSHLWQTTDGGATWLPIFLNSGLPDAPYNNLTVDPDDGSVIYLATDVGVYSCIKDSGCQEVGPASNSETSGYLPNVPVLRVQIQKTTSPAMKLLKAITYGRGAWVADITGAIATGQGVAHSSSSSVAFGGKPISATNSQKLDIVNTGNGTLTITSITTSGSAFSQSNTCGTFPITVSPNAKCSLTIKFKPLSIGAKSGSLTLVHNGTNPSPLVIPLSGVGEDFSEPQAVASSATVAAGATANFILGLFPLGSSFESDITLSCVSPLPTGVSCSFSPAVVNVSSVGAHTSLSVTTTNSATKTAFVHSGSSLFATWFAFPTLGVVLVSANRRLRKRLLLASISIVFLVGMTSCGGGTSHTSQTKSVVQTGTQPGTYPITVLATSSGLTHSTQLTITVQ